MVLDTVNIKVEVYLHEKGYGVRVTSEDAPVNINQDVMPSVEGFQPMTEEEARAYGEALKKYYEDLLS